MNVWFQMHKAPRLFPVLCYSALPFKPVSSSALSQADLCQLLYQLNQLFFAGYLQGTIPQFFWVLIFLYAISIYSINHSSSHSMLWKMCHSNCWLTYTTLVVSKLFWFHILINKMFMSLHPLYMCIYLVITLLLILLHICTIVLIYCVYY